MKKIYHLALLFLLVSASCGDGSGDATSVEDISGGTVDTLVISAMDTIGTEMGDTPDVFAFIVDAAFTPLGNVAVLDAQKISLQVFSPEGQELNSIGRKGSAPGEYQLPMGLAVIDDGFVVSDIAGGKILNFTSSGELNYELDGFFPVPPARIRGAAGNRFLASDIFVDMNGEDGPVVSMDFVAYSDSTVPETVFKSYRTDTSGGMINSNNAPSLAFAAGSSGEAYLVEMSDSLFMLTGYSENGEETLRIEQEHDRIPLSEEELEEEVLAISLTIENGETALGTSREPRADTHRDIIEGVGVDGEGRIWVRMGDTGETYFRVYAPSGSLEFIAVPDETIADDARYSITPYGMLAYDADPEDWPKIYLLGVM